MNNKFEIYKLSFRLEKQVFIKNKIDIATKELFTLITSGLLSCCYYIKYHL